MKTKLAAAMVAAALAGCGGGGEEESNQALSYSGYSDAASAICKEGRAAASESQADITGVPKDDLEALDALGPQLEQSVEDFEALDPPAELQETHDEYVAQLQRQLDGFTDAKEAAEADDTAEYQRVLEAVNQNVGDLQATASKLGAEDCL